MRTVVALLLATVAASAAGAADFYFDSEAGSDRNAGTSAGGAFKSLAKLGQLELKPGDVVRFRRGCTWRGQLSFKGNGSEGSPIRLGAYGEGPKPEILGSMRPSGWQHHAGEAYRIAVPADWLVGDVEVNGVFLYPRDRVPIRLAKASAIPSQRGQYWFDPQAGALYVTTPDGRSPAEHPVELLVITPLLDLTDRSWIEIEGLAFLFGGRNHWRFSHCTDITVRDCAALFVGDKNPAVVITNGSERVRIVGCFIYDSANNGILMTAGATRCEVRGCTVVKGRSNDGVTCHTGLPGQETGDHNLIEGNIMGLWPENSVDITSGDYHVIRGNLCYNDRESNIVIGHGADHILVQNNICIGSARRGIQVAGNEAEGARGGNMIYQNLMLDCAYPLELDARDTKVYNNTVVDVRERPGVRLGAASLGSELRNNLIVTLRPEIGLPSLQFLTGDPRAFSSTLDHNVFYHVSRGDKVLAAWTGTRHDEFTPAEFLAKYGTGGDSFVADPRFATNAPGLYLLAPDSPCIDTGVDVGLPFSGRAPDVGWKERGSEADAPRLPAFAIEGPEDEAAILYLWGKLHEPPKKRPSFLRP